MELLIRSFGQKSNCNAFIEIQCVLHIFRCTVTHIVQPMIAAQ